LEQVKKIKAEDDKIVSVETKTLVCSKTRRFLNENGIQITPRV